MKTKHKAAMLKNEKSNKTKGPDTRISGYPVIRWVIFPLVLFSCLIPATAFAAETDDAESAFDQSVAAAENAPGRLDYLVFKMMIVNPSDKYKQTYPMKAYLPAEVLPEHVLDKEDLSIAYDTAKQAYYISGELELDPGQSVVKAIKIEDIWVIPEEEMKAVSEEAHELLNELRNTKYEKQGKLLVNNVETLLLQIFESQNDESLTPDEHIQVYRENKKKMDDVQMDLMALRRFVVSAGGDLGVSFGKDGGGVPSLVTNWQESLGAGTDASLISPGVLWRVIFTILAFTGLVSLVFFFIWQDQLRTLRKRSKRQPANDDLFPPGAKRENALPPKEEKVKFGDFIDSAPDVTAPPRPRDGGKTDAA